MVFNPSFVPTLPFKNFKWQWACLQCTEGLNDPVVLLGVLFRMRKLEQARKRLKYSSKEFANELRSLSDDIKGTGIGVDLAGRTGSRNLIRNSGQYWRALGLIPATGTGGIIQLTDFGREVADRTISQTEFAAITIRTLTLPNRSIQKKEECDKWDAAGLQLHPLLLLLNILKRLSDDSGQGYLTKEELISIVIPLSGTKAVTLENYVEYIKAFRKGGINTKSWPNCCPEANDHRMAREFLLFLANYGYTNKVVVDGEEQFQYNEDLDEEISTLLSMPTGGKLAGLVERLKSSSITSEIERKRVQLTRTRPNQARFRKAVLGRHPRCVITNVTMPEVLEAAHIVPVKYHGDDTIANGFTMRMDIHQLFDSGHLRIQDTGTVVLTANARLNYGALVPPCITIPSYINKDFVRWRWDNYNGI